MIPYRGLKRTHTGERSLVYKYSLSSNDSLSTKQVLRAVNRSLHDASSLGDVRAVRMLIEAGAYCNDTDTEGFLPLHRAVDGSHPEVVRYLLEHGAQSTVFTPDRTTPLHMASQNGDLSCVKTLLQHGALVNVADKFGSTPLHDACEWGNLEVAQVLLPNCYDLQVTDNEGRTPLHSAARGGNLKLVRLLIANGADATALDNAGESPLHAACYESGEEVVAYLLDLMYSKYDSSTDISRSVINCVSYTGMTPLHCAAQGGDLNTVRLLLSHGALVNAVENSNHYRPLHLACFSENNTVEVVLELLEKGANVNCESTKGITPLNIATFHGHSHVVQLLLRYGADVNAISGLTMATPLHFAHCCSIATVRSLLDYGANLHATDHNGCTPLHTVSGIGTPDVVQHFVERGACINQFDHYDRTPLHVTCEHGNVPTALRLLQLGANVNMCREGDRRTPLIYACLTGQHELVELFIEHGASLDFSPENDRCNPLLVYLEMLRTDANQKTLSMLIDNCDTNPAHLRRCLEKALWIACLRGFPVAAMMMIYYGANVNAVLRDKVEKVERTPLDLVLKCLSGCSSTSSTPSPEYARQSPPSSDSPGSPQSASSDSPGSPQSASSDSAGSPQSASSSSGSSPRSGLSLPNATDSSSPTTSASSSPSRSDNYDDGVLLAKQLLALGAQYNSLDGLDLTRRHLKLKGVADLSRKRVEWSALLPTPLRRRMKPRSLVNICLFCIEDNFPQMKEKVRRSLSAHIARQLFR